MSFSWNGPLPPPDCRTIEEMRDVLADPGCSCEYPLYYMYRGLAQSEHDAAWLEERQLRYDITAIPPRVLCGEYVKTKGHHHPEAPAGTGYPEIYEVLEGSAHYMIQDSALDDAVLIAAGPGEKVIIPPGYGHVTINPGTSTLIMANIVSTAFSSDYSVYEKYRGAAYYEMEGGSLVRNPRYPSVPPLRRLQAARLPSFPEDRSIPLYHLIGSESALDFLNSPENYLEILAPPGEEQAELFG